MTQYKRITGKVFGGNATATGNDPQIAQFGSALAGTFVGTTDPETIQSLSAWGQGWIGAVTPETQFPPMPEMTGAMNVLSHQICGILQQGVSTWDSGTIYYAGNFCSKSGIVYVSLSDTNQGNDPETDTINWRSYGGADIDLSNLSSQGKNIANWSTNVTNCITEIPQRIKLDLNNGTLTLKAGSIVIIPNGFEADGTTRKFNQTTLRKDCTGTVGTGTAYLFSVAPSLYLGGANPSVCYSGDTAPDSPANGNFWYDTKNNIVKRYQNNAWSEGWSLPICEITAGAITNIFNGIGYIGSTIWVDKGIKCLIPNGRNEDGTLNNVEYTTDKVITFTNKSWTGAATAVLGVNYLAIWSDNDYRYNEELNTTKYKDNTTISIVVKLGNCTLTQGVVSNFNPKQPFRAVDYNDYTKDLDTKVNKTGDTMTGILTVKMPNNSTLSVQSSSLAYNEVPSSNGGYGHFAILDKNGEWGALYGLEKFTDGKNVAKMQVKGIDGTYARISVGKRSDGSAYFDFPKCSTKATTTSSAKNDLVAVVVQNYVNGYAWMRKWSDGWIEQGGRMTVSYEQIVTTNFVTSFSNTDYYVTASPINWQNIDDNIHVVSLTTSSCGLYGTGIGNAGNWNTVVAVWYACGY